MIPRSVMDRIGIGTGERAAGHGECFEPIGDAGHDDRRSMNAEEAEFTEKMADRAGPIVGRYRDDSIPGMVYSMKSIATPSRTMFHRMRQFMQTARQRHRQKR